MASRPNIDHLVWDDWNRAHIARHGVLPEEAEEVIAADSIYRESYKDRLAVTGSTVAGRMLTIVVGPVPHEPTTFYAFSARPASRRERREYHQQKGGSIP